MQKRGENNGGTQKYNSVYAHISCPLKDWGWGRGICGAAKMYNINTKDVNTASVTKTGFKYRNCLLINQEVYNFIHLYMKSNIDMHN